MRCWFGLKHEGMRTGHFLLLQSFQVGEGLSSKVFRPSTPCTKVKVWLLLKVLRRVKSAFLENFKTDIPHLVGWEILPKHFPWWTNSFLFSIRQMWTDSWIRRKKTQRSPAGDRTCVFRLPAGRSNYWATKPRQELRANFLSFTKLSVLFHYEVTRMFEPTNT